MNCANAWLACERRAHNAVVKTLTKYSGPGTSIGEGGIAGSEYLIICTEVNAALGNPADDFKGLSAESATEEIVRFFARALGSVKVRPKRLRRTAGRS